MIRKEVKFNIIWLNFLAVRFQETGTCSVRRPSFICINCSKNFPNFCSRFFSFLREVWSRDQKSQESQNPRAKNEQLLIRGEQGKMTKNPETFAFIHNHKIQSAMIPIL